MADNRLYYGDNLDVLQRYVPDGSVDLVYLDPPFNSNATYNVLFAEQDGARSSAQLKAFEDSWRWDESAVTIFQATVKKGGPVSDALRAFYTLLGDSNMMAYLAMMAPRLVELHRVLKPTGSLYLHCDPTASHYLKLLLDAVFGPERFGSEIVWKRSSAHSDTKQGRKLHGHIHDTILFYTRTAEWTWNPVYTPYDQDYIDDFYRHVENGTSRRYRLSDLTAAKPGGDTEYDWWVKRSIGDDTTWHADLDDEHGSPRPGWEYVAARPYRGRYWAYSRTNMTAFEREGRLYYSRSGTPSYKRYLDEMPGIPLQDLWTDIPPIAPQAAERLGYPTQKPVALLERILLSGSNPGDTVLDPFAGCGTAIDAAQKLGRRWIGIDVTNLAITLIKTRLLDTYGDEITTSYTVIGEPTTEHEAHALALQDRYQFQWWALGLVGARLAEVKKGADKGIDGRLFFYDDQGAAKQVILSVKSGAVSVRDVRDLGHVVEREQAAIGALITLEPPTLPMRTEAAGAGHYWSEGWQTEHPRLQIVTIAELLAGKKLDYPFTSQRGATFRPAPRAKVVGGRQGSLPLGG